jgi:hypothetical protein
MTHLALIACSIFAQVPSQEPASTAPRVHKIAVGGDGGWDYLTVDPDARRLYVATVDIGRGSDGCGFDAAKGLAYSANGGDGTVTVIGE